MPRTFLKLLPLVLLFTAFQCKRDNDTSSQNILTGKLVIDDGCGQFAVEVLSGDFDPARVTATWTDTDNDSVYHNIFRLAGVRNACLISYYGVSKGDTFQFRMDPGQPAQICMTCDIRTTLALPPVSNNVRDVKLVKKANMLLQ